MAPSLTRAVDDDGLEVVDSRRGEKLPYLNERRQVLLDVEGCWSRWISLDDCNPLVGSGFDLLRQLTGIEDEGRALDATVIKPPGA